MSQYPVGLNGLLQGQLDLSLKFSFTSTFRTKSRGLFYIRINMEIWILQRVDRNVRNGDKPCHKAAIYTGQHKHRSNLDTDIHASSENRTYDPSVREDENRACLRLWGQCDQYIHS
jgi:hypothetical protein